MQPLQMLAGLVLTLVPAAGDVSVPAVLYRATVSVPEAEVRSGPSTKPDLYSTNRLRQGDPVEVVKELEGGWLAIKPPAGSFSWINTRFLEQSNRTNWTVAVHPDVRVPVLYGSSLRDAKPTVEGTTVKRGTQLYAIGPARSADDGIWLPIDPPPTEVRYLRAEAVVKSAPVQTVSAAAPAAPAGGASPRAVVPAIPASSSPGVLSVPGADPRWQQAQQLEQAGNRAEAIRLYEELGQAVRNSDEDLALRAFTRAQYLRNAATTTALQPARPARTPEAHPIPSADNNRLQPMPASLRVPSPPSPCVPCQTTSANAGHLQRSGAGRLRRSAWWLDGQPTYALEDAWGRLRMYVTAQPGVNLEPHLNRNVELFGSIIYRGYPPVYHIKVVQVAPVQ
jgi:hypothetical protein